MTTKIFYFSIFALLITISCKKKEESPEITTIDVSQQWYFDFLGVAINPLNDGQWQSKVFTSQEQSLFNSLDTANLTGTISPTSVIDNPPGYNGTFPNPFSTVQSLNLRFNTGFSGQLVIKVVIVDSKLTPYYKISSKLTVQNSNTSVNFNPTIPIGRFRFYYTLSSQSNPHFFKSWGNIQKVQ